MQQICKKRRKMKTKPPILSVIGHRTDGDYNIDLQEDPSGDPGFFQHCHVNFEVAYQLSGKRKYDYSGETYVLNEGDVLVIPPGTLHETLPCEEHRQAYVLGYTPSLIYSQDISFRNLKYLLAFSGEHSFVKCRFSGNSEPLSELRAEILKLAEYGNFPRSNLLARASILKIHDLICRLYNDSEKSGASEFVVAVETCIMDRISEDISPSEIANLLHISHSSLCHRLKAELNCTPNELIMRHKLNYAERLLLNQRKMTVTDVGITVGIPNTSYFIKCFKKSRGMTPVEFRKYIREQT